jgi:hypothetical protein
MKNQICCGKEENKIADFWRGRKSEKWKRGKKGGKIKMRQLTV